MSAPATIDLAALLAPIPGPEPAGGDPRRDASPGSLYYRAKDARAGARAAERAGADAGGAAEPWAAVLDAGRDLLRGQAKDVEVAAWLTEALVRTHGFPGLRDGFSLLAGLAERFWDGLHPRPDEDGLEARVAPVAGLNGAGAPGTLAGPIRTLPLVGVGRRFSLWSYERMLEADRLTDPDRRAARLAAGAPSMRDFQDSLAETPASELGATLEAVEESVAALGRVAAAFAVAGPDAPPTDALAELLGRVAGAIRAFGAEALAPAAAGGASGPSAAGRAAPPVPDASVPAAPDGRALAREEALAAVLDLAAHFRRTEPQAPISYTLEEAVRRARLSLPDLLAELSLDAAEAARVLAAAGIRPGAPTAPSATPPPAAPLAAAPLPRAAAPARSAPEPSDGW